MRTTFLNSHWIIEVDITHRCNLVCRHCNRLCNAEKIYHTSRQHLDMEKGHIDFLCRQIMRYPPGKIHMLRILGGEPLLSPILEYCIHTFENLKKYGFIKEICVVSNGTIDCPYYASKYITYYPRPIKDMVLDRGRLQKEDVYRIKEEKHINITITPSDYKEKVETICDRHVGCGIHYTVYGFCLSAPCFPSMFVFPINHNRFKYELPESIDAFLDEDFTNEVCSVCYYALNSRTESDFFTKNGKYIGNAWKEQIAINKDCFEEPKTDWIKQINNE